MLHRKILASGLLLLLATPGLAAGPDESAVAAVEAAEQSPSPGLLAAQIAAISRDNDLSFAKKENRIVTAVRLATASLLAPEGEAGRRLAIAVELAEHAAAADPRFTAVIVQAILSSPSLAGIDGAPEAVRAAAYDARPKQHAIDKTVYPGIETVVGGPQATISSRPTQPRWDDALFAGNSATHLTLDANISYDDNVYLTEEDRVSDQIVSFSPGVDFTFGQNSLLSGSVQYQMEFLRYLKDTAPDAKLSHANAGMKYGGDRLNFSFAGSYNEQYQNNRNTLTPGERAIFETNSLSLNAGAGLVLTPLTSVSTGANYSKVSYEVPTLFDSTSWSVPLAAYYRATAKLDVSAGATYSTNKSGGYGTGARDWYYNVGLRGDFTAKLNGSLTSGYRTRRGTQGTKDSMLGFTAGLNLELTAKSSLSFNADRDFSTSAQGQSLKNSSYSLALSTEFSPRWQASARVAYQQADYGEQLYGVAAGSLTTRRKDDYYEGGFSTSFLVTGWLNTSASYTLRSNDSSLNAADFSNNLLSISVNAKF